jgi:hypothetical protein
MLVIPSLIVAPWLLTKISSRKVQVVGFLGCALCNLGLALGYGPLKARSVATWGDLVPPQRVGEIG